jgi:hypothetical protein
MKCGQKSRSHRRSTDLIGKETSMTVEADDARVASLGWQRSPSTYGSDVHSEDIKKVAIASAIGNMIEYYDFTLYATATALVFNKIFFPSFDPLVGSLAAFATFFIGYCARPLGGVLFGHLGDRIGRKTALLATILIMGFGTVLIGLMPSYDSIGIWAPVGLIILRMLQGIGIGGEYDHRARAPGQTRILQLVGPCRRARRFPDSHFAAGGSVDRHERRCISRLGLATSLPVQHCAGRHRPLHPGSDFGDAGIQAHACGR